MSGPQKNKIESADSVYLAPDVARMVVEFEKGQKIGESCRIKEIEDIFCWMRGFLNCFTGWHNSGKTRWVLFLMLVKSIKDGWKWGIWSPEEIDTYRDESGKMRRTGAKIYNILIHMMTGMIPYQHWESKFGKKKMDMKAYMAAHEFISQHFFVLDTKSKEHTEVIDGFQKLCDVFKLDGILNDPFKNLILPDGGGRTMDRIMETVFDDFETLSLNNNIVTNFIAHPKSLDESQQRVKGKIDGPFKVVTEFFLLGGSAWGNSMDGIFSLHRPEAHSDPNSSGVSFFTLKQRDQELTTRKGRYDLIDFDFFTQRYYFNGVCPIDGSMYTMLPKKEQPKPEPKKLHNKKEKEAPKDFTAPLPTEDIPF